MVNYAAPLPPSDATGRRSAMRILFVYSTRDCWSPRHPLDSFQDIHLGLSSVSAFLKARNHATRLAVVSSETPAQSGRIVESLITEFDPQMVAFTAVATQFGFVSGLAQRVKERWPDKFCILGGAYASLCPAAAIQGPFDALCVGEGEYPMAELAAQLAAGRSPQGIANLWLKKPDGGVEKNPAREFMADLGALPVLDREMWRPWIRDAAGARQVVLPSRGCPYNCSYCSNHALRKLAGGQYVRSRPPANVLAEIRELKSQFPGLTDVYLQSETIAVDFDWLEDLCRQLHDFNSELPSPIAYTSNFRVARPFLEEKVFAALARANVRTLEIGLESGSERLRREVLRRNYSNVEFFQAVALARQHGMKVNLYNMIGLPGETLADYWQTRGGQPPGGTGQFLDVHLLPISRNRPLRNLQGAGLGGRRNQLYRRTPRGFTGFTHVSSDGDPARL